MSLNNLDAFARTMTELQNNLDILALEIEEGK